MENQGFIFGFGSLMLCDTSGNVVGAAHITGALTGEIMAQAVKKNGGASSYPVDMRLARSEGNITLTLNERKPWIDTIMNEGTQTDVAAAAAAAASAVRDLAGNTLAAKLTAGIKANTPVKVGYYYAERTAANGLKVTWAGPDGGGEVQLDNIVANTVTDIGDTGVTITASNLAFAAGAKVAWDVEPAHGGKATVKIPQVRKGKVYELVAWGASPSTRGNIERVKFPAVMFQGANWIFTDNEYASSGIEITGGILAPIGGGEVMERVSYAPV